MSPLPADTVGESTEDPRARTFLRCPRCRSSRDPAPADPDPGCRGCGLAIPRFGGVLDFLGAAPRAAPAAAVEAFYNQRPFPGYAPGDDAGTLLDRCRASPFLDALDRGLAADAAVLDAGCGTGQLASFLALAASRRRVFAVDASRGPLREADRFRRRAAIANLELLRADLFALPFAPRAFDAVVSRGVIHHTGDPFAALGELAERVAPGGYLVLGWYESLARRPHQLRRLAARLAGRPVAWLDPILRRAALDAGKRAAWIADQYHHPLETSLALPAMLRALSARGLRFVRTVPPAPPRRLFAPSPRPAGIALLLRRLDWLGRGVYEPDAGLVSVVARRPAGGSLR